MLGMVTMEPLNSTIPLCLKFVKVRLTLSRVVPMNSAICA